MSATRGINTHQHNVVMICFPSSFHNRPHQYLTCRGCRIQSPVGRQRMNLGICDAIAAAQAIHTHLHYSFPSEPGINILFTKTPYGGETCHRH